ncbi:MAG: DUF433 domain-containing protein, partial [Deltaproteobacteria bacterium]|nr:DUF433 domain-containing protein [Deltaproteobacteria bacterium]
MATSSAENKIKKQRVIITQVGIYENKFELLAKQVGKDEKKTKEAFLSLERRGLIGRHRFGKLRGAGETVYLCPPVNKTQISVDELELLDFFYAHSGEPTNHLYIVRHNSILGGEPIVAGSRISVSALVTYWQQEYKISQILDIFPHLSPEQV